MPVLVRTATGTSPEVEDFESFAVGAVPPEWTAPLSPGVRNTFTVQSITGMGKVLQLFSQWQGSGSGSGFGRFMVMWTGGPSASANQTMDVLALLQITYYGANFQHPLTARNYFGKADSPATAEVWRGQSAWARVTSPQGVNVTSSENGAFFTPATANAAYDWGTALTTPWHWVRLRAYGKESTAIKVWPYAGGTPPASWMVDRDLAIATTFRGVAGVAHQYQLQSDTRLNIASVSVFVGDPGSGITVTGLPAGYSLDLDGVSFPSSGGSATATLIDPHFSGTMLRVLDESDQEVETQAGPLWEGDAFHLNLEPAAPTVAVEEGPAFGEALLTLSAVSDPDVGDTHDGRVRVAAAADPGTYLYDSGWLAAPLGTLSAAGLPTNTALIAWGQYRDPYQDGPEGPQTAFTLPAWRPCGEIPPTDWEGCGEADASAWEDCGEAGTTTATVADEAGETAWTGCGDPPASTWTAC